jgi:hypothetical protein
MADFHELRDLDGDIVARARVADNTPILTLAGTTNSYGSVTLTGFREVLILMELCQELLKEVDLPGDGDNQNEDNAD